jgi:hypothetical protein
MIKHQSGLLLLTLLTASAGGTHTKNAEPVAQGNHSGFSTYSWDSTGQLVAVAPTGEHHAGLDSAIRQEINKALTKKGYRMVPPSEADFSVDYLYTVREEAAASDAAYQSAENNQGRNEYGFRWHFGESGDKQGYQGVRKPRENVIFYETGVLHIGAFSRNNQLIWHHSGHKMLKKKGGDNKFRQDFAKIARKIMSSFNLK